MIAAVRAATPAGRPAANTLITTRARPARRSMLQSSYPVAITDQSPTGPSRYSAATWSTSSGRLVLTRLAGPAAVPSEASPVTEPAYSTGRGRQRNRRLGMIGANPHVLPLRNADRARFASHLEDTMTSTHDFTATTAGGDKVPLSDYA